MTQTTNRRGFLQATAATGVGYWVAGGVQAAESESPNEQIQFACIGIDGKGRSDSDNVRKQGRIAAICDVDTKKLEKTKSRKGFEDAKAYTDFREMLDQMGPSIDAVTVSTPDHCHAPASVMAMKMGKHCFCQKPLSHSISEARVMAQVARETGVATQMGNQYTALGKMRKAAAMIRAGQIGTVQEVHVWTNRPVWPQGGERPEPEPIPSNLNWDLWLGPAPYRPYGKGYHPFAWRGWWDFGTGALGDMACHTCNLPFRALDLRDPISVHATSAGHNKDSYPEWSHIEFEFPATASRPALKMIWYDGGQTPDPDIFPEANHDRGVIFIGDRGKMFAGGDYAEGRHVWVLYDDVEPVDADYVRSPGHVAEWVRAIRGGDPAASNFPDYAGPLTETIMLGNLAVWSDKKVAWDAETMTADAPELQAIVRREYRDGYSL